MCHVDGAARLAKWRSGDVDRAVSPIEGGAGGVRLTVDGQRPTKVVVELGGGALTPGPYALALEARATSAAATPVRLQLADAANAIVADVELSAAAPLPLLTIVVHRGGILQLTATLTAAVPATVLFDDLHLDRDPADASLTRAP